MRLLLAVVWLLFGLLQLGCSNNNDRALVEAALSGNLSGVQALVKSGANIEATALDGLTPLDAAAKQGQLDTIQYLLKSGAAVNGTQHTDRTPLGLAIIYEHTDCAQLLLSRGGELRGTMEWKHGLLETLKRDNKTQLAAIVEAQISHAEQSPRS